MSDPLPHPLTGRPFDSPVPPGTGWPGDVADAATPVAASPGDVAALAASATDLDDLAARITVCRACPRLVDWRETVAGTKRAAYAAEPYWGRPVAGIGDPAPQILLVGLAPAAHGGNRTGRMFTGDRSGDWLIAALHRVGLANQPTSVSAGDGLRLERARISAPVHCAPPDNRPSVTERDTCAPWLGTELDRCAPTLRAVVALGGFGWAATLTAARAGGWHVPRPRPKFGHGREVVLTRDGTEVTLLGCYHVSQQNTFTGRLTEPMLDAVFRRALEI